MAVGNYEKIVHCTSNKILIGEEEKGEPSHEPDLGPLTLKIIEWPVQTLEKFLVSTNNAHFRFLWIMHWIGS